MRAVLAVLLAFATASLYALSTSTQALEARRSPRAAALRASLIGGLLRRPLWLAGTVAGIVAWPLQAAALSVGSVALVQPALGFGLVVLLLLGVVVLNEHVGRREVAGVLAIVAAVGVLGWAAPSETGAFSTPGTWAVVLAFLVVAPSPLLLRLARGSGGAVTSVAAGLGWAWVGLATSLLDDALGSRNWLVAVAWVAAIAAGGFGTLVSEMTSLQTWPATRAVPVAFGIEMVLPAALAPLLTHASPPQPVAFGAALVVACAGAAVLGASPAVARAAAPLTAP